MSNLRARKPQIAPPLLVDDTAPTVPSIVTDLGELSAQLSFLRDSVMFLGTKLEPVRALPPGEPGPDKCKEQFLRSPVSSTIQDLIQRTNGLRYMVAHITDTLDIGAFDN